MSRLLVPGGRQSSQVLVLLLVVDYRIYALRGISSNRAPVALSTRRIAFAGSGFSKGFMRNSLIPASFAFCGDTLSLWPVILFWAAGA
ncbi:MAG: hypothetical protein A4E65_02827 [Syntrophorhabdus sp. PtaU1.Bin153]|nr:MAG: hypothetical protein A4E65_02827 [Syntrophorhabdus sp. PtaU1.Bin153]